MSTGQAALVLIVGGGVTAVVAKGVFGWSAPTWAWWPFWAAGCAAVVIGVGMAAWTLSGLEISVSG